MISVNNLSLQYKGVYLFKNISFVINPENRIGLIGKNGSGKTTLLRILSGMIKADEGKVITPKDMQTGFLQQEIENMRGKTVFEETFSAFKEVVELKQNIEKVSESLVNRTDFNSNDYLKLATQLNEWSERYNFLGGDKLEGETEKVLKGLGFVKEELEKPVESFSGGWQMRIALAKLLLTKPGLLLLDEPDNHLDIESIQWLEQFLKTYPGAIIIVSHDKNFLDNITNRTIEISNQKIYDYKASYTSYTSYRKQQRELENAAYKNQLQQQKETERFVERFKAKASKAKQVQSRIKHLEKNVIEAPEEEDLSAVKFHFPEAPRTGKIVLETKNLSKYYGNKQVLDNINFMIGRGEKIAFVGKNGEGKTTLSKIIAGDEQYDGKLDYGHNVTIGYFAQHRTDQLDTSKTIMHQMEEAANEDTRSQIRNILGSFLFSGDDVNKKVKVLSGGEKSRLLLARLLLKKVNLLILDEPTNHLDILTRQILKNALSEYKGAMIVVSHDRDFLKGLTQKTFEFKNRSVKIYEGDIYYFLQKKKIEDPDELNQNKVKSNQNNKLNTESGAKKEWLEKKALNRELRLLKKSVNELEKKIGTIESEMHLLESELSDPQNKSGENVYIKYDKLKHEHEKIFEEWEILVSKIDKLE